KVPKMVGYAEEFGSKKLFRLGYQYGYLAGYADSAAGKTFRLIAIADLPQKASATVHTKTSRFEDGVLEGYRAGRTGEAGSGLPVKARAATAVNCAEDKPGVLDYCEGYSLGVRLGAGDRS